MKGITHTYEVLILEKHLDSFGHMNNAVYFTLFEEARWDMITSRGYGLKDILRDQKGPTLLEVTVRFKREILLRENITIESEVTSYTGKIGVIHQEMKNRSGEVCAAADFKVGLLDMKARRLIPPTPEWQNALGLC